MIQEEGEDGIANNRHDSPIMRQSPSEVSGGGPETEERKNESRSHDHDPLYILHVIMEFVNESQPVVIFFPQICIRLFQELF